MSADDVVLFVQWLLEQGVWIGPLAFGVLYLNWPKELRGPWLTAVKYAFAALFVANVAGVYPGPARVSCAVGPWPMTCIERTAGALAPDGSVGAGVRTTGADGRTPNSRAVRQRLSDRYHPQWLAVGSLTRAGAAPVEHQQPRPIQAGAGIVSRDLPRTPADATGTTGTSTTPWRPPDSTTPPRCGAQQ